MKKIPSLYERDWNGDRARVLPVVNPAASWVLDGIGVATRKRDGTCCMVRDGRLWKRYDVKAGKEAPPGFVPAQQADPETGHWPGWLPVGDGPADQWHREAFGRYEAAQEGATYELCGPKVQANAEGLAEHQLLPHGVEELLDAPREFDALREYLAANMMEGIVWHAPDGRMAKIKARDFGLKWPR